jgi:hypothetical protein
MNFSAGNRGGGIGSRIMGAIIGVPIGIVLVFGSCFFLYWNEGRTDYSKIASKSVAVQASRVDQSHNGKFVSVTGNVSTGEQIGDGAYLKPGSYVAVKRIVEEYAWVQQTHSSNSNGNNTTSYSYTQAWTSNPQDSSSFNQPNGHTNYPMPIESAQVEASTGKVGAYSFDPQSIKLPPLQDISLDQSNVNLSNATNQVESTSTSQTMATAAASGVNPLSKLNLANSQYLYGGNGTLTVPQIGDIRISFQGLTDGTAVTMFGTLKDGSITSYTDTTHHTLFDLIVGDRQTAIATLHTQYEKTLWLYRAIGVAVIWIGLMMLFGPLDLLLDFIPVVGEIGGFLTLVITFPVALVLGGTVILIGYSAHHPIDLIIGVPFVLAVWIIVFKMIKNARNIPKRGNSNQNPPPPSMTTPQDSMYEPPPGPIMVPPSSPPQTPPPSSGSLFPPANPS